MPRSKTKQLLQKKEELEERAKDLEDQALVDAVLECSEDLKSGEFEAFSGMAKQIARPFNPKPLSELQRSWLVKVYVRCYWEWQERAPIELTQEQRAEFQRLPKYPWELNKPLKPPGRV